MSLLVHENGDRYDKPPRPLEKVFHRMWKSLWRNPAFLWGKLKKCSHAREFFDFWKAVEKQAKSR